MSLSPTLAAPRRPDRPAVNGPAGAPPALPRETRWALVGGAVAVAIPTIAGLAGPVAERANWELVQWTVAALAAVVIAASGIRHAQPGFEWRLRTIVSIGLVIWFVRQLLADALGADAAGSALPDVAFLAGAIPLAAWLAVNVRRTLVDGAGLTTYLDVAIVMLAVVGVTVTLQPAAPAATWTVERIVQVAHPVFVIGAVGGILVGALTQRIRVEPRGVWLLIVGALATGLALTARRWAPIDPSPVHALSGQVVAWAILLVAVGGSTWSVTREARPAVLRAQVVLQHVVPLAGVGVGALMILASGPNPEVAGTVLRITVAVSTGLLVLRQTLLLRERGQVLERLSESHAETEAALDQNRRLARALAARIDEMERVNSSLIAASRNAAIGELSGAIAHEVNNPLTGILGYAELLIDGRAEDDPDREELETIRSEALRARRIVRSLVQFANPTAREVVPVDLAATIRETVDLLRYHVTHGGTSIEEVYDGPETIEADPAGIGQVVLNLLHNAAAAVHAGGTIRVTTATAGDQAVLTVADDGDGMDDATQARAFDLFFTTRDQDQGHGLGLPASRRIVETLGGTMSLQSTPGRGTVVTVRLPIRQA